MNILPSELDAFLRIIAQIYYGFQSQILAFSQIYLISLAGYLIGNSIFYKRYLKTFIPNNNKKKKLMKSPSQMDLANKLTQFQLPKPQYLKIIEVINLSSLISIMLIFIEAYYFDRFVIVYVLWFIVGTYIILKLKPIQKIIKLIGEHLLSIIAFFLPILKIYELRINIKKFPIITDSDKGLNFHEKSIYNQMSPNTSDKKEYTAEFQKSFLNKIQEPFMISLQYGNGIEFNLSKKFYSEKKAKQYGNICLHSLKTMYPGLSGDYEVNLMSEFILFRWKNRSKRERSLKYEIKLPQAPYPGKLWITYKFANLLKDLNMGGISVQMIINKYPFNSIYPIIKRSIKHLNMEIFRSEEKLWVGKAYKMKIFLFISAPKTEGNNGYKRNKGYIGNNGNKGNVGNNDYNGYNGNNPSSKSRIMHVEQTFKQFAHSLSNYNQKAAKLKKIEFAYKYNKFCHSIIRGTTISEYLCDFDFSTDILPRARKFTDNFKQAFVEPNSIDLGYYCKNFMATKQLAYIRKSDFLLNSFIAGTPGMGKTVLLNNILDQFMDIGILIINTAKNDEYKNYPKFHVFQYGDQRLTIPYIFVQNYPNPISIIKATSEILAGSMGLFDVSFRTFSNAITEYYNIYSSFPSDIRELFQVVFDYIEERPLSSEEQQNLIKSIVDIGLELVNAPHFVECTRYAERTPFWFAEFLNGSHIFIDLSFCDSTIQTILVASILNMIKVCTYSRNNNDSPRLRNLIVFDECHTVFGESLNVNEKSDEFIRKKTMKKFIYPYLTEYRTKEIGLIMADQQPHRVFDIIPTQSGVKIIFNIPQEGLEKVTPNNEIKNAIMFQEKYQAIIINNITGEFFQVLTHPPRRFQEIPNQIHGLLPNPTAYSEQSQIDKGGESTQNLIENTSISAKESLIEYHEDSSDLQVIYEGNHNLNAGQDDFGDVMEGLRKDIINYETGMTEEVEEHQNINDYESKLADEEGNDDQYGDEYYDQYDDELEEENDKEYDDELEEEEDEDRYLEGNDEEDLEEGYESIENFISKILEPLQLHTDSIIMLKNTITTLIYLGNQLIPHIIPHNNSEILNINSHQLIIHEIHSHKNILFEDFSSEFFEYFGNTLIKYSTNKDSIATFDLIYCLFYNQLHFSLSKYPSLNYPLKDVRTYPELIRYTSYNLKMLNYNINEELYFSLMRMRNKIVVKENEDFKQFIELIISSFNFINNQIIEAYETLLG